jgi:alkylation response protein AidB-like acyl-CoA dehydrogenase
MTKSPAEKSSAARDAAGLLARAQEIAELAHHRARLTETERRISDDVMARIVEADLFRILQPRARGGLELDMETVVEVTAALGRGCGSTAWVFSVCSMHQWFVACMDRRAQDDFWADSDAIAAGSYPPVARAVAAAGGWRISGAWSFASGCDNAQWYFLGAHLPPAVDGEAPRHVLMMVPRRDVRIEDTWHTMGLAGTGSKTIVGEDVMVPEHRVLPLAELLAGNGPGTLINTNPFYRQTFISVVPCALLAPILGMAEGALAQFVEDVRGRTTRGAVAGGNRRMAELATVQSRVAEAAASIDAARLLMMRDLAEVREAAGRGTPTPLDMRLRNRLDHAFCARLLLRAVDALFDASGGQSIGLDKPIQRVWRDAHAAASHLSLNWDAVSTMYGQHVLGLAPQGQY